MQKVKIQSMSYLTVNMAVRDELQTGGRCTAGGRRPHRAVGSPALCGLKLLCEFSQARAGERKRKRGRRRKTSQIHQDQEMQEQKEHASVPRPVFLFCRYSIVTLNQTGFGPKAQRPPAHTERPFSAVSVKQCPPAGGDVSHQSDECCASERC